ncbi:uncharacterized protein SETTUDRAFT_84538 [Exserohilum turcica Et28A]|uniref:Tc1-like transposase DDE domain-containing protein n=1 Tax=Exserohilum turcicum (strain 28A) TaxID=671987 RepID=R0J556_EXST2|nr:uncharacterized protein SETTUDRAFT_84538 [Exserohilum turcica Et28A]EOA92040.1 hypothetical protein SETTUDRAFT_84538 [Exserohilum turcica Et28A]
MAPNTDISTRSFIVALKSPFGGKSTREIAEMTGISPRTIDSIYGRACQRGFEPNARLIKILPQYLEDAPRAGRPRKQEEIHDATLKNTSVVLNHRRGGYRVWRRPDEVFTKSVIRERWKGYSEFMFWGCFTYDYKGPCHVWRPETAQEKRDAALQIEELDKALEPLMREAWELTTGIKRLGLRNKPGRVPQWRWVKETGKLARESSRGGIDWWRYQTQVLIPKLIPFAKECQKERPRVFVQEDKAPSHTHHAQRTIYRNAEVEQLPWPGNSPDLNAIEAAWPWLKRKTTRRGAPKSRAEGTKVWQQYWDELPQHQIQAWIERIPFHIQEIIKLEGGNEYKEGRRDRST